MHYNLIGIEWLRYLHLFKLFLVGAAKFMRLDSSEIGGAAIALAVVKVERWPSHRDTWMNRKKSLRLNLHSLCGLHIDPGHKMRSEVFVSSLSDFRMATARKRCERKQNAFGSSRFNDSRPSEKSIGVMLISFGLKSGCGLQLFSNLSSVMSRVTWDVILKGSMQNCEISYLQKDFN